MAKVTVRFIVVKAFAVVGLEITLEIEPPPPDEAGDLVIQNSA